MKRKRKPVEYLAFFEGSLLPKRKKALLASMNKDETLRRQFMEHAVFEKMMQMSMPEMVSENAEDSHLDEATLGDFLENRLAPDKKEGVKLHLRTCMECFVKMAKLQKKLKEEKKLQYAQVPSEFIEKAKQLVAILVADEPEIAGSPRAKAATRWQRLVNKMPEIWSNVVADFNRMIVPPIAWAKRHPIWSAASAGLAVATIILFMLLLPAPAVENLSRGNKLIISGAGTFGFVDEPEVREYKSMHVSLSEDGESLIFRWEKIPEALSYEIVLRDGEKRHKIPFTAIMDGTSFTLPNQEVQLNTKYTWELSGKLKDGRTFMAKAEFIRRK